MRVLGYTSSTTKCANKINCLSITPLFMDYSTSTSLTLGIQLAAGSFVIADLL